MAAAPEPWRDMGVAALPPQSSEAAVLDLGEVPTPFAAPAMPASGVLGSLLACCTTASGGRRGGGGAAGAACSCAGCALTAASGSCCLLAMVNWVGSTAAGAGRAELKSGGRQWQA